MIPTGELTDPAVRAFVAAVNANDRAALQAAMTPNATMSDDGTDRLLDEWLDREVFDSSGRMDVDSESADGRDLTVYFTNETWGQMKTRWHFAVRDGKVERFDTGQA